MTARKSKRALPTYRMTRQAEELLLSLVANLIGEKNLIPAMAAHRVVPELIPASDDTPMINFARTVLFLLYKVADDHLPPTQDNIIPGLLLEYGEEAPALMQRLMNHLVTQDADASEIVQSLSLFLSEELGLGTMRDAADLMAVILQKPRQIRRAPAQIRTPQRVQPANQSRLCREPYTHLSKRYWAAPGLQFTRMQCAMIDYPAGDC